jgi:hypothetical protein
MSTSPFSFRRRARRGALALIVGALLVAPGSALAQRDAPADYPGMPGNPQTQLVTSTRSGDNPVDYPGMSGNPGVPASFPSVAPPHASEGAGFDWTSAVIGAGVAGLVIVLALAGATTASRVRVRTVRS